MKFFKSYVEKFNRLRGYYETYANENAILVYQMGKVGSTSIEKSISGALHIHTLFNNPPCFVRLRQRRISVLSKFEGAVADWIKRLAIKNRKKVKIVTMVRNPFSRDVSMFFQNLPEWLYEHTGRVRVDNRKEGFSLLVDAFNHTYDRQYALTWFDKEIKKLTGVDVFQYSFDREKGSVLIKEGKYEILLFMLEKMSDLEEEISEFVSQDVSVVSENSGDRKWYAEAYKTFKDLDYMSDSYYREVAQSKLYKKFYE